MSEAVFTSETQALLERAVDEANGFWHSYLGTEHILLGLLSEPGDPIAIFKECDVTLDDARDQVMEVIGRGTFAPVDETIPMTPRARNLLALALRKAHVDHRTQATPGDLAYAIVRTGGVAAIVLKKLASTRPA